MFQTETASTTESTPDSTITGQVSSPCIQQAIFAFLTDVSAGHSPATAKTYRVSLTRFSQHLSLFQHIDPETQPVANMQIDWAVACVRWIASGQPENTPNGTPPPVKPAEDTRAPKTTVATYIAGLSRFYKWCTIERLLQLPADDYERMIVRFKELRGKVKRTIIDKVPGDDILEALLTQARKEYRASDTTKVPEVVAETEKPAQEKPEEPLPKKTHRMVEMDRRRYVLLRLRNIAILETLKSTGARVSEVTNLKRGDLDATNRRARVVGKGSKERWVYFSPQAWQAIQEYLQNRSRLMAEGSNAASEKKSETDAEDMPAATGKKRAARSRYRSGELASQPLFARHDRGAGWRNLKPLLPHAIEVMLWELVEKAGLEVHITPHKFRHWFATRMLSATGDLATTQDLLGHANPATTRIYAQVSEKNKQEAHRNVFG